MFDLNIEELMEIDTPSNSITVPEGGTASFQVRLTSQPNSEATISVAHIGGDADISVQSGSNLVFNTGNWNQYQLVTLAAAEDADDVDGIATIRLSITGLSPAIVIATEQDVDIEEPPDCGIAENGQEAWTPLGSAVVVSGINSIPEIVPVDGLIMSLLRTNGNMRASDAEMENTFAIPSGSLDTLISGDATLGSACYRTINAAIGDTIEFSWNFIAGSASGRDFAFAVVDGQAILLLDVDGVNFATSNPFFKQSGWRTFRYTFTQAGPQTIAVGAIDENSIFGAHLLTVDKYQFIPASP
jgi:hypothetical protein